MYSSTTRVPTLLLQYCNSRYLGTHWVPVRSTYTCSTRVRLEYTVYTCSIEIHVCCTRVPVACCDNCNTCTRYGHIAILCTWYVIIYYCNTTPLYHNTLLRNSISSGKLRCCRLEYGLQHCHFVCANTTCSQVICLLGMRVMPCSPPQYYSRVPGSMLLACCC